MSFLGVNAHKETTEAIAHKGAKWLRSKYAATILALISFAESVFLPVLIDPFLIALILANPKRWRWYVIVSVAASTAGGILAYWIGAKFFETFGATILGWYGMQETFTMIATQLDKSGFVFVLIGAFTPIPYKIVALASGVLHIQFATFLVASLIGRILRLGLVGMATHVVGPHALPVVRKHLHHFAAVVGILLVLYLLWSFFV